MTSLPKPDGPSKDDSKQEHWLGYSMAQTAIALARPRDGRLMLVDLSDHKVPTPVSKKANKAIKCTGSIAATARKKKPSGHVAPTNNPTFHSNREGPKHRRNCERDTTGGQTKGAPGAPWSPWNAHHLVTVFAVNAYQWLNAYNPNVTPQDIRNVYDAADWCINHQDNMLALPTSKAYTDKKPVAAKPCHSVDHNCCGGYSDEVVQAVYHRIWLNIEKKSGEKSAHFTAGDLATEFRNISRHFRKLLAARGKRPGTWAHLCEWWLMKNPRWRLVKWREAPTT